MDKTKSCQFCTDRQPHCHASCSFYKERVAKQQELKRKKKEAYEYDCFCRAVLSHGPKHAI